MPKNFTKAGQTAQLEPNASLAVTPSDTVDVSEVGALLHVNKTGNYNLLLSGDTEPKVFFLIAGMPYPYRVRRVYATDTDYADGLIALLSVYSATDIK